MKEVDVVVGILSDGDRFLVEKRMETAKVDPSVICLPGGHVEPFEDLLDALKREMCEELNIKVNKARLICRNLYVASNGERQNAYCFHIDSYEGTPVCKTAQEIYWESNVERLSLEVDRNTITKLKALGLLKRVNRSDR
ncbi:MAG: NUDIX domain-containing protein [Candidatus Bathyarchaeota archaeon]|nr:MAG: NUDIX domain-containing protein [Candidatus Bathyarchaeota archaeon]